MLQLVGPSSEVCFTSLSAPSIPPLRTYLSSAQSGEKAVLDTAKVLSFLAAQDPPIPQARVCLLDPKAERVIAPEDADKFDVFLYGGILGDDPPRDRTGELRALGFEGRHLGPVQMTTDTALGVTKKVVEDGSESLAAPQARRARRGRGVRWKEKELAAPEGQSKRVCCEDADEEQDGCGKDKDDLPILGGSRSYG